MPVKTSAGEFKRFYNDPTVWKDDMFHEGEVVTLDGVEVDEIAGVDYGSLDDGVIITIAHGVVYADARGNEEVGSLEGLFRKWRRQQTTDTFMVEVPKEKADAVRAAIKAAGGKALR